MRFFACLFLLLFAVQVQAQEIGRWSVEQKTATALDSGQECIQVRFQQGVPVLVILGEGAERSPLLVDLFVDDLQVGRFALTIEKREGSTFIAKGGLSTKSLRAMMNGKFVSIRNTQDGSDRGSYRLDGFREAIQILAK